MAEAAADEEFERAAVLRDRLEAVRTPDGAAQRRRRVAGERRPGRGRGRGPEANAQVFQVRDGVLAERHGFYLANEAERDEAEVDRGVPRPVLLRRAGGAAADRRRPGAARARPRRRRGPLRAARGPGGGPGRRARRRSVGCASSPQRNAALALAQDRLRQERRRAQRVDALSALQDALGLETLPVRIEGFDISNIGGEHTVASMVVFEGGAPRKSDYRRFRVRGDRSAGPDDFSSIEEVLGRRVAPAARAGRPLPARLRPRRELRVGSGPDRDRRRQGAALGRHACAGAARRARHRGDRAREALEEVYVPGRSQPLEIQSDSEACGCCSASATRRTGSRSSITAAARQGDDELAARRAARRRARAQAGPARALRLSRAPGRGQPRGARGRARASRASSPARSTASSTGRASGSGGEGEPDEREHRDPVRQAGRPDRDHRLLGRRQVGGDRRLRGLAATSASTTCRRG